MSEKYVPHSHQARNVNEIRKQKHRSLNDRIAIAITRGMGTMPCAYIFALLAIVGFPGLHATLPTYVQWLSQVFIQLVALAVLANGQSLMSEHQEVQATESYHSIVKTHHDTGVIVEQNNEIIEQNEKLIRQSDERDQAIQKQFEVLAMLLTPPVASRRSRARKQEVDET